MEDLKSAPKASEVYSISINDIIPNPSQPRKIFAETSILRLADSIRQFGIIQPLTVRKLVHHYELVAGERRLRAAKELGWDFVPCIIASISEERSAEISIIENLLREDLNIFEQALAIETLIDTYNLTQEQVAERLSSSQSYIANKLRLLRFSQSERERILLSNLSERHARALLRISDPKKREDMLNTIIAKELNVANTENLINSYLSNSGEIDLKPENKPLYKDAQAFFNAVNRAIGAAETSNLNIKSRKIVGDAFTEIVITIPSTALEQAGDTQENQGQVTTSV